MSEYIVVIFKEVGKEPEFKRIENNVGELENLIGGELDYISYEDITIITRKNRENLKPNIYINTEFLGIGSTIRGNVVLVCIEDTTLKTLTRKQAVKYREVLIRASFNYDNFDEKGRYIPPKKDNKFKKRGQLVIEKGIGDDDIKASSSGDSLSTFNSDETLKMILGIQSVILQFIKNNVE